MGLGRSTASLLLLVALDGWRTACCDWLHANGDTSMWVLQLTAGCMLGMGLAGRTLVEAGRVLVSAAAKRACWSCAEVSRLISRPAGAIIQRWKWQAGECLQQQHSTTLCLLLTEQMHTHHTTYLHALRLHRLKT